MRRTTSKTNKKQRILGKNHLLILEALLRYYKALAWRPNQLHRSPWKRLLKQTVTEIVAK